MRILAILHEAEPSGATAVALSVLRRAVAAGHSLDILLQRGGTLEPMLADLARSCALCPSWPADPEQIQAFLKGREMLQKRFASGEWDVVYANTAAVADCLTANLPLRPPVVWHLHESRSLLDAHSMEVRLPYLLRHLRALVAVSDGVADVLRELGAPDSLIRVIPPAIEAPPAEPPPFSLRHLAGAPPGVPLVAGCGTLAWYKGADLFVQVARRVLVQRPECHFIWLGDYGGGIPRELLHDCRVLGLTSRVHFPGHVPWAAALLAEADLLALTSREDSWPLVMLEAARGGVPLVAFERSGGGPQFASCGAGLTVPYLDTEAFAAALVRLLADPDRLAAARARARAAAAPFTVEACAGEVLSVLETAAAAGPPPELAPASQSADRPTVVEGLRFIAIHLPQFHPIAENDAWWGRGFTEWTNVTAARPFFPGHYQPRLPADLGFYDLRNPEALEAQAALARQHGIEGFCFYHYWFGGRRLLERPVDQLLASGRPDFPFCLCWANETWSRRWLGEERDILMAQVYSADDDRIHAEWLTRVFEDPRYIRIGGRPVFIIYRPADHPDLGRFVRLLRYGAERAGRPWPLLLGSTSHSEADPARLGVDGLLLFRPSLGRLPLSLHDGFHPHRWIRNLRRRITASDLRVYDYRYAQQRMHHWRSHLARRHSYPTVMVNWDNSARRGRNGVILHGQDPKVFEETLEQAISLLVDRPREERVVFLNAWNEWAEGNHLEPCARFGDLFLRSVSAVQRRHNPDAGR